MESNKLTRRDAAFGQGRFLFASGLRQAQFVGGAHIIDVMRNRSQQLKISRVLTRLHWCAALLFLCAMILWFVAPATPAYLLMFAAVGVLWSVTVVWMWRLWSFIGNLGAMLVFAFGYLLPPRLFSISSQVGELQGLFLAFSIAAFLLWLFRTEVIRYARLER